MNQRNYKRLFAVAALVIAAVILLPRLAAKPPTASPSASVQVSPSTAAPLASIAAFAPSIIPVNSIAAFAPAASTQPKIVWSPTSSIEVILSPGETSVKDFTFTSDQTLQNAVIEPVPALAGYVTVQPSTFSWSSVAFTFEKGSKGPIGAGFRPIGDCRRATC
jgi:hypothetical protein